MEKLAGWLNGKMTSEGGPMLKILGEEMYTHAEMERMWFKGLITGASLGTFIMAIWWIVWMVIG